MTNCLGCCSSRFGSKAHKTAAMPLSYLHKQKKQKENGVEVAKWALAVVAAAVVVELVVMVQAVVGAVAVMVAV